MNAHMEGEDFGAPIGEPLRKLSILVCMPSHGEITTGCARSIARAMCYFAVMPYNGEKSLDIDIISGSNLCENRTRLVSRAFEIGATHILWVDTDMKFPEDAIPRLLNHNKPVVGANYPQKTLDSRPTAYRDDDAHIGPVWTKAASKGLEPVAKMGLGLVLMETWVFNVIELPYFNFEPLPPDNVKHLTEDYYLCKKLKAANVEMFIDHDLSRNVAHIGPHEYTNGESEICQDVKMKLYADLPL